MVRLAVSLTMFCVLVSLSVCGAEKMLSCRFQGAPLTTEEQQFKPFTSISQTPFEGGEAPVLHVAQTTRGQQGPDCSSHGMRPVRENVRSCTLSSRWDVVPFRYGRISRSADRYVFALCKMLC